MSIPRYLSYILAKCSAVVIFSPAVNYYLCLKVAGIIQRLQNEFSQRCFQVGALNQEAFRATAISIPLGLPGPSSTGSFMKI